MAPPPPHHKKHPTHHQARRDFFFRLPPPPPPKKKNFWVYGQFRTGAGIRCWKQSANTTITSAAAPPTIPAAGGDLPKTSASSKQPKQVAASVSLMRDWPQLSLSKPVLSSVTLRTDTGALSIPELNSFELRGGNMAEG